MRTTNPALNANVFNQTDRFASGETMTLQGTVNKSIILLCVLLASASWIWGKYFQQVPVFDEWGVGIRSTQMLIPFMIGGGVVGFITALVTIFKKPWAPITAPIYALCEGFLLGGLSAMLEVRYPGIVMQAVGLTFGTLFCLLMAYTSRLIKPTENFKLGIVSATGAICLIYFVNIILSFFGVQIPMIHSSGIWGIGFSLFVVTIAALNLVLDFDFIEQGAASGVPRYMEWYAAFGLMVTLIWLYIEILRLLAKLRNRR